MNREQDTTDAAPLPDDGPSKSQRKRDALQAVELAKALLAMPVRSRAKFELPIEIDEALRLADDIRSNGAKKRQLHYVGKLLRGHPEYERLWQLYEAPPSTGTARATDNPRRGDEEMCDRLLQDLSATMDDLRSQYPQANIQLIRQLVNRIHKTCQNDSAMADDAEKAKTERNVQKLTRAMMEALAAGRS